MKAKRFILMLLVMLMSVTGAWAETVYYIDVDGTSKYVNATVITNSTSTLTTGWYVVKDPDVQTGYLRCNGGGDIKLILADGAKLTANGNGNSQNKPAIMVGTVGTISTSLTIYGQSAQTGQLIAVGGQFSSGIGGGPGGSGSNITINGGTVTANGGECGAGIGGGSSSEGSNITINGGTVIANGGNYGAGIGGGKGGSGSDITINGGNVTANGGNYGAGIGGGQDGAGSDITINGGIVTATGGNSGAGIGGGDWGSGSNITINGGIVTATGGNSGAGIGGGWSGSGSNITINGGTVTANGGKYDSSGIGSGESGSYSSNIYITPELRVRADNNNPPTNMIAHSSITEDIASSLNGKKYVRITNFAFITLNSADESQGTVFGEANDEFAPNSEISFCAIPAAGYKFSKWSDGSTENPRQYVVMQDASITAIFEPIKVFNDPKGAGMRLKLKKKDGNVYEFKTSEVESVDYYRANK